MTDQPQMTDYRPTVTSTVPCLITGNPQCGEPFCQHEDGRCYLRDKVGKAESTVGEATAEQLRAERLEQALRGLALTASEFLRVTLCDKAADAAAWRKLSGAVTRALESADAK